MTNTLTVAVCQFAATLGDVQGNARRMADRVRSLSEAHADLGLVVFPELALTGYEAKAAFWKLSGEVPAGVELLREAARTSGAAIAVGLPERDQTRAGVVYDALQLIGPDGRLGVPYRKVHLWQEERQYFAEGERFQIARCGAAIAGLGICWDISFPEWSRACAVAGADVLLVASAWDDASIRYWDALLRARAIENGCYVVAANLASAEAGAGFGGHSQILSPTGDPLGFLDGAEEGTLVATLDLDAVGTVRFGDLTALRDLRPDVYAKPPHRGD